MKNVKTPEQIKIMRKAGNILGQVLDETIKQVRPGVTELELDEYAHKRILELGGEPGFRKVKGYHHTICVATNDVVVHGIPAKRELAEGNIIGIDCGVFLEGLHTDMAETVIVGKAKNPKIEKFLRVGKEAMFAGIKKAEEGNRVGDISYAIQEVIEGNGYSVVRSLVGHGVGVDLHEDPQIPGYLSSKIDRTPLLTTGMTIAIEAIYNMGKHDVVYDGSDDWTISTKDRSLAGLFERTVLVTNKDPELLTPLPKDRI